MLGPNTHCSRSWGPTRKQTNHNNKWGPYSHGVYNHMEENYENAINKQVRTIANRAKWYTENPNLVTFIVTGHCGLDHQGKPLKRSEFKQRCE